MKHWKLVSIVAVGAGIGTIAACSSDSDSATFNGTGARGGNSGTGAAKAGNAGQGTGATGTGSTGSGATGTGSTGNSGTPGTGSTGNKAGNAGQVGNVDCSDPANAFSFPAAPIAGDATVKAVTDPKSSCTAAADAGAITLKSVPDWQDGADAAYSWIHDDACGPGLPTPDGTAEKSRPLRKAGFPLCCSPRGALFRCANLGLPSKPEGPPELELKRLPAPVFLCEATRQSRCLGREALGLAAIGGLGAQCSTHGRELMLEGLEVGGLLGGDLLQGVAHCEGKTHGCLRVGSG